VPHDSLTAAPLLGEPLPVELMNTIWADRGTVYDALTSDAEAHNWLLAVEPHLTPLSGSVGRWLRSTRPRDLSDASDDLRRLRDALRRLAATRTTDPRPAAASAVEEVGEAAGIVNEAAESAPRWHRLHVTTAGFDRSTHTDAPPGAAISALVAEQAIDLFTGELGDDLRACLAPGCVLYFVKQHPRREWCSAACGNRARAARHYQRHRSTR